MREGLWSVVLLFDHKAFCCKQQSRECHCVLKIRLYNLYAIDDSVFDHITDYFSLDVEACKQVTSFFDLVDDFRCIHSCFVFYYDFDWLTKSVSEDSHANLLTFIINQVFESVVKNLRCLEEGDTTTR